MRALIYRSTKAAAIFVVMAFCFEASPVQAGNCSWIAQPTAINFGVYNVFATSDTATQSNFSIRCTPNTYGRVTITPVAVPYRTLAGGALYNLYLDNQKNQIWGDANSGGYAYERYNGTPSQKDFADVIYGFAPPNQSLAPGTYTATVNVTLAESGSSTGPWSPVAPTAGYPVTVTLTVVGQCRVDTFALSFDTYDPFSTTSVVRSTTVKVYCTPGTGVISMALDNGLYPNGTQRRMYNGTDYLNYDAVFTGTTTGVSTSSLTPIASGFPLRGTVGPQQDVSVGSYFDTLQAIVNY